MLSKNLEKIDNIIDNTSIEEIDRRIQEDKMLSKEEIEDMKDNLKNLHHMLGKEPSISKDAIENALQYIEQLETKEQKLIEKLEEVCKKVDDEMADFEAIEIKQEILKIVKGEKE